LRSVTYNIDVVQISKPLPRDQSHHAGIFTASLSMGSIMDIARQRGLLVIECLPGAWCQIKAARCQSPCRGFQLLKIWRLWRATAQ
jgi:hypothetical protein